MAGLYSTQTTNNNDNPQQPPKPIPQKERSDLSIVQSLFPLRMVGYGLLVLVFFDLLELIYPPQFMNPTWEFQAFGQIVERAAIPLIGLSFIFFARDRARISWETFALKFLYWVTLILAIVYFLLIPLGIANTVRINRQNTQQISNQSRQRIEQVQQAITTSQNKEEIEQLIQNINQLTGTATIESNKSLPKLKKQASTLLTTSIHSRAEKETRKAKRALLKSSLKWNLGALISGVLFLVIWDSNRWIGQYKFRKPK